MAVADLVTCQPFTGNESTFESPMVYSLIEFGATYEHFDPLGKLAYLDEIQKVQDRWDILFTRCSLMCALKKDYVAQCDSILASMGKKEADFRQLLKHCHDIMREEAERERNT